MGKTMNYNYRVRQVVIHVVGLPVALIDIFFVRAGLYNTKNRDEFEANLGANFKADETESGLDFGYKLFRRRDFLGNVLLLFVFVCYYGLGITQLNKCLGGEYPYSVLRAVNEKGCLCWAAFILMMVIGGCVLLALFTFIPIYSFTMIKEAGFSV